MNRQWLRRTWMVWVGSVAVIGCQRAVDPAILAERAKYIPEQEPAGAIGVVEAREKVLAGTTEVVLVGRVGADPETTFDRGQAAFLVVDPAHVAPAGDHGGEGHDHDNCPFCQAEKKKAADASALIRVVDASGAIVPLDARKLLDIQADQLVVVRGAASFDEQLKTLVVAAQAVYPRR